MLVMSQELLQKVLKGRWLLGRELQQITGLSKEPIYRGLRAMIKRKEVETAIAREVITIDVKSHVRAYRVV